MNGFTDTLFSALGLLVGYGLAVGIFTGIGYLISRAVEKEG